ncbi:MAG: hypothetical protein V4714_08350 [Bacteroidota bacterium]
MDAVSNYTTPDFTIQYVDGEDEKSYNILEISHYTQEKANYISLEPENYKPITLPYATIEEAQEFINNDPFHKKTLANIPYKIVSKEGSKTVLKAKEDITRDRPLLNEFQVIRMMDDIQKSPMVRVLKQTEPKLNIHVIDGYLTFSQGYAGWVRANFYLENNSEAKTELMLIDGFSELITKFFNESNEKYSEWEPVVSAFGIQIKVS